MDIIFISGTMINIKIRGTPLNRSRKIISFFLSKRSTIDPENILKKNFGIKDNAMIPANAFGEFVMITVCNDNAVVSIMSPNIDELFRLSILF